MKTPSLNDHASETVKQRVMRQHIMIIGISVQSLKQLGVHATPFSK